MSSPEEKYLNPTKFVIRKIDKNSAEKMIVKYHYSHKFSLYKVAYGIFHITEKESEFVEGNIEELVGCCVYAYPVGRGAAKSISDKVDIHEVYELVRLFVKDNYGKNIESYFVSKTLNLIKKDFPHIKVIISYSDTEQGHKGGIYQATNFLYGGLNSDLNLMDNFSISLSGPPNYNWLHSRTVFSRYGSHNVEHLKKKIGQTFWRKKEAGKHKYFYILSDKKEKREILKSFKIKILSYPKNCNYNEEIEEIKVDDISIKQNQFFYQ